MKWILPLFLLGFGSYSCSDSKEGEGWETHTETIIHATHVAPVILSLTDGPTENEEFGVELVSVSTSAATVRSIRDGKEDTASIGEYFDGGSFGRIGLRLMGIDPETKTVYMMRSYASTSTSKSGP